MTASTLLLVYCSAIIGASLLGGFIPHWIRLTHTRLQIALSFTAGAMLGVGLLHLVPHAYFMLQSIDRTMGFALLGFLVMFFIERVFHFHHHGSPDEEASSEPSGHDHDCAHGHHAHDHGRDHSGHHHGEPRGHAHGGGRPVSWSAALLGLALHSLLDGVALAASVSAELSEHSHLRWAGLAVFLVVVLHKPFDSLTLGTLMAVSGRSARLRHIVNVGYACAVPLGAALFEIGFAARDGETSAIWIGGALALAAGTFLCISTSDLLPELQFHTHDRGKLSAALIAGLALAWGIVFLEERGHDQHQHRQPANGQTPQSAN